MKRKNKHIVIKTAFVLCSLFFALLVQGQSLEEFIDEALTNNPEIQSFELKYNIANEKIMEVNSLPNTEFSAGYFVSEPETRVGAQQTRFSVKQKLPWFGTITSRENYVSSLADAQFIEITIAKRKLVMAVSQSYYTLYTINAKQEVLAENLKLLNTYEKLALTSVEVGKASAVSVLKLQIRKNELDQHKQILQQQYIAEQVVFNNLLDRNETIGIKVTDELFIPVEDLFLSTEDLHVHPELLKYDKLYESVEKSEILNQKESSPNFGLGLDYITVSERPNMNFDDNGKDIFMPMVSLSIPIFNKKYKSKTKQNAYKLQEIKLQKIDRLNKLENLMAKAINNKKSAKISYTTQVKNLKQAKDAESILVKSYETGTINFNDVLDIQALQLKFQINQIEAIKKYYMQLVIINYLSK